MQETTFGRGGTALDQRRTHLAVRGVSNHRLVNHTGVQRCCALRQRVLYVDLRNTPRTSSQQLEEAVAVDVPVKVDRNTQQP